MSEAHVESLSASLAEEEQLVAFRLAEETFGIPIALVHEIIRPCDITRIPRTPDYVRGVLNLRGKIVPVVDLRLRLGIGDAEATPSTRIVVVEMEQAIIGLLVDAVSQVVRLPGSQIEPPSDLLCGAAEQFIRGVGKLDDLLIVLLDVTSILDSCIDSATDATSDPEASGVQLAA